MRGRAPNATRTLDARRRATDGPLRPSSTCSSLPEPVEDLVRDPPTVAGLHERERIGHVDFGAGELSRPALCLQMHHGDALVDLHAGEAALEVRRGTVGVAPLVKPLYGPGDELPAGVFHHRRVGQEVGAHQRAVARTPTLDVAPDRRHGGVVVRGEWGRWRKYARRGLGRVG